VTGALQQPALLVLAHLLSPLLDDAAHVPWPSDGARCGASG
jgi:hypothetical protein